MLLRLGARWSTCCTSTERVANIMSKTKVYAAVTIFAVALTGLSSRGAEVQERTYNVVELLANQADLTGKPARVAGSASCSDVVQCALVGEGRVVPFTAVALPEADRKALLLSGPNGTPGRPAVVTLTVSLPGYSGSYGSKATAIEFTKR